MKLELQKYVTRRDNAIARTGQLNSLALDVTSWAFTIQCIAHLTWYSTILPRITPGNSLYVKCTVPIHENPGTAVYFLDGLAANRSPPVVTNDPPKSHWDTTKVASAAFAVVTGGPPVENF